MKIKKDGMLALAGMAFALSAQAEDLYLGGALSRGEYSVSVPGASSHGDFGGSTGARVYGGVQLTPTYGVEGGYTHFGKGSHPFTRNSDGAAGSVDVNAQAWSVAGTARMPLNDRFALHAKLGAAYRRLALRGSGALAGTDSTVYDTRLLAGVGASWALERNLALNLDYDRYGRSDASSGKLSMLSLGVDYHF